MQLQIAIDVSCFSYALRFAHTSIAGYNRLWGSSVSQNCSVIYNLKDSSDIFIGSQSVFSPHMDRYASPYRANRFLRLMQCNSWKGPIKSPPYGSGGFQLMIAYHGVDFDHAISGRNRNFGFR